jgi:hypothetical protein
MASEFGNQIENRNFLSPVGFNFTLANYQKVSFFSNSAAIPEIILGNAIQPTYLKNLDVPGDILTYDDFTLRFLVDESLENYMLIHNWLTGLGFPESPQQFKNLIKNDNDIKDYKEQYTDGSLSILNSNYNTVAIVKFRDLYPVSLTSLDFEAGESDINYFTASVTFKYTIYEVFAADNRTPL